MFPCVRLEVDAEGADGCCHSAMKYHVTLIESDEGWAVWCEDLPGCCSQGASRAEALANIKDAINAYLAARNEELMADAGVKGVVREEVFV